MAYVPLPILVLAAGASRRFGDDDKLLADVAGQPLLAWTLEGVLDAVPSDQVLVLLDTDEGGARRDLCDAAGVSSHIADHADRGMGWTLFEGLDACAESVPGAIVVLADDPLTLHMLPRVAAVASREPTTIVAVRRDPFVPHPVYLPRSSWPASPPEGDGDHGLRQLLDDSVHWIDDDTDIHPIDVDTQSDRERLTAALGRTARS